MLDAKELLQLKQLQDKLKKSEPDLTEAQLAEYEERAVRAVNGYDTRMQEIFVKPWTECERVLRELADDNVRLIAEVRKIQSRPVPSEDSGSTG